MKLFALLSYPAARAPRTPCLICIRASPTPQLLSRPVSYFFTQTPPTCSTFTAQIHFAEACSLTTPVADGA